MWSTGSTEWAATSVSYTLHSRSPAVITLTLSGCVCEEGEGVLGEARGGEGGRRGAALALDPYMQPDPVFSVNGRKKAATEEHGSPTWDRDSPSTPPLLPPLSLSATR